jgi:hypothetical protein
MFTRVSKEVIGMLPPVITNVFGSISTLFGRPAPSAGARPIEEQVEVSVVRFFERMPASIEANILAAQSPDQWAQQVVDHVIETLQTLVRIARVDHAEELMIKVA